MSQHDTDRGGDPEGEHRSIWMDTTAGVDYDALEGDLSVDVAVVGGGIAGVSAAHELVDAGRTVALLERDRLLGAVTGHTTAKLTSQHGLVYDHLVDHFGERRARQYAEANQASIDRVESTAEERDIDCDFERAPAYTYTDDPEHRDEIRDEVEAARRLGLPASFEESTELPFEVEAAVRFDDQAHYHPRSYLLALAESVAGDGGHVFENTRVTDVEDGDPCRVVTDRGDVVADDVVIATHFPFFDHALFFSRLSPKRSYVLAARLNGEVPEGMYYRSEEPYFSVRPHPAGEESMALLGGQNHRTGHGGSTRERYRALERQVRDRFDVESIEYRWSTQDYVSVDRVPFVGKHAPQLENVYVATGFGGWGMTNGIAAGRILSDLILGSENPWSEVYRPTRFDLGASKRDLLQHNAHAMRHFLEDRLGRPPRIDVGDLDSGEGKVVEADGTSVALSRDDEGELHAVSAVCTHMGCRVEWNDGEESWDCPCHGSRFDHDGSVLDTPAVEDLRTFREDELRLGDGDRA